MRKIRTGITIQIEEVLIVRATRGAPRIHCQKCRGEHSMVTAEQAMVLAGTTVRGIYQWVEAGRVHYTELPEGVLLVCTDSLLKLEGESKRSP